MIDYGKVEIIGDQHFLGRSTMAVNGAIVVNY